MKRCLVMTVTLVLSSPSAVAAIYRCEQGGRPTYTDRPCDAQAEPLDLPGANVYERKGGGAGSAGDLARQYDERLARERKARDHDDAEWLKTYDVRKRREARIREGLLRGEVVAGMNAVEVRQVLGEPERVTRQDKAGVVKETWTYRDGAQTRSVNFKDGEVTSASKRKGESKRK